MLLYEEESVGELDVCLVMGQTLAARKNHRNATAWGSCTHQLSERHQFSLNLTTCTGTEAEAGRRGAMAL